MSGAEDLTYRLSQVQEAMDGVQSGRWSAHRFEEAVRVWLSAVQEQEHLLAEIPAEGDRAEVALGRDGARLYREGLSRMLCFVADRNPLHLREGMEQVRDGNERLNHAVRLNSAAAEILGRLRRPDP